MVTRGVLLPGSSRLSGNGLGVDGVVAEHPSDYRGRGLKDELLQGRGPAVESAVRLWRVGMPATDDPHARRHRYA